MGKIPESSTSSTQGIADYINSKFSTPNDKSRAIFLWIAKNIDYDIANRLTFRMDIDPAENVDKTLKSRKGVCINYAELFRDIANKVGIKSYVVPGYTKQSNIIDNFPHAWCAALIDSEWFLFDPTWGAGIIRDSKFIKQINIEYCKLKPEEIIDSHMPFDPLWQLLTHPITNQEFYEGSTQMNTKKPYFNFKDSLLVYDNQSDAERLISSNRRIERNGVINSLISDRLEYNRKNIVYYIHSQNNELLNSAVESFNNGSNLLNKFVIYYNNLFIPQKSDAEIQLMIDTVSTCFKNTRNNLSHIKNPDANFLSFINKLNKSLDDASVTLDNMKAFLKKYFNTRKIFRKSLFYKFTGVGVTLNK